MHRAKLARNLPTPSAPWSEKFTTQIFMVGKIFNSRHLAQIVTFTALHIPFMQLAGFTRLGSTGAPDHEADRMRHIPSRSLAPPRIALRCRGRACIGIGGGLPRRAPHYRGEA